MALLLALLVCGGVGTWLAVRDAQRTAMPRSVTDLINAGQRKEGLGRDGANAVLLGEAAVDYRGALQQLTALNLTGSDVWAETKLGLARTLGQAAILGQDRDMLTEALQHLTEARDVFRRMEDPARYGETSFLLANGLHRQWEWDGRRDAVLVEAFAACRTGVATLHAATLTPFEPPAR